MACLSLSVFLPHPAVQIWSCLRGSPAAGPRILSLASVSLLNLKVRLPMAPQCQLSSARHSCPVSWVARHLHTMALSRRLLGGQQSLVSTLCFVTLLGISLPTWKLASTVTLCARPYPLSEAPADLNDNFACFLV